MLDRLDYLQKLLPSGNRNRVVPVYMFTTDEGLPVILRVNMGNARSDIPVALVAFDLDPVTPTIRCEIQYPTEHVKHHLYGKLTGKRFTLGTTEIDGWSALEALLKADLVSHEAEPIP
ncbi:hypothetical protein LRP49_10680 [Enterovibrio sp. ZSDZ35]|uniref:PemK-like, MazF-like toxin of type II toxin-antitoxin system n=1 Tax=Enterovibrio qingdaonensis TaxID=2899818 RepID=A0ABT5QL06_9GAMM|nr:hypothetical protein [Enterovibrio sp. ZSDZ35]MDD1781659.1 hypothetical protein [Enterovibrio sp. ZSDZ35]